MSKRKKILWISDGVILTGFGRVAHSIIGNLPNNRYEIHHLAVNYYGDPHNYKHKIYPAALRGDVYGLNRIPEFANLDFDLIFIFNDAWIINEYLIKIKEHFKKIPPIVVYFPIDGRNHDPKWYLNFDLVTIPVVYTQFGYDVAKKVYPEGDYKIIYHGVDSDTFYKTKTSRSRIKKELYPKNPEIYEDSFIVLNANRNQPRKRIDMSIKGFALFVEGRPKNIKYYHHAGTQDAGWDVIKLCKSLDIEDRLILTSLERGVQKIPDFKLNLIYNATDVGLNTSLGEGWGLPNCEHAVTGAPQVVPDASASKELFEDCGLLIPINQTIYIEQTLTIGDLVRAEDVAEKLAMLYDDKELYKTLAEKCMNKFTSDKYSWRKIAKQWHDLFQEAM